MRQLALVALGLFLPAAHALAAGKAPAPRYNVL